MSTVPPRAGRPALAILVGGVIAGLLDICFAFVFYGFHGSPPVGILQSIASGLLGNAAFEGGAATAALGAVFQLVIPTIAAAVYFVLTRVSAFVRMHAVACGLVYGIVVWAGMTYVVLPLSAIPWTPKFKPAMSIPAIIAHMFFVGLPIALANRKYANPVS
jgi:uncharacterized membrane protein